jgi:hypothetical protein
MEPKCEFCNRKDAVGFFRTNLYIRIYSCKECYEVEKPKLEKRNKFYFLDQVHLENIRRQDRDRNY